MWTPRVDLESNSNGRNLDTLKIPIGSTQRVGHHWVTSPHSYSANQGMNHACLLVLLVSPDTSRGGACLTQSPLLAATTLRKSITLNMFSCTQSQGRISISLFSPLGEEVEVRGLKGSCLVSQQEGPVQPLRPPQTQGVWQLRLFQPLPESGFDFLEDRCTYSRVAPWFSSDQQQQQLRPEIWSNPFLFWSSFPLSQIPFSVVFSQSSLSFHSAARGWVPGVVVTQLRLTLCDLMDFIAHPALLSMGFPRHTGMGCHFLLQWLSSTGR